MPKYEWLQLDQIMPLPGKESVEIADINDNTICSFSQDEISTSKPLLIKGKNVENALSDINSKIATLERTIVQQQGKIASLETQISSVQNYLESQVTYFNGQITADDPLRVADIQYDVVHFTNIDDIVYVTASCKFKVIKGSLNSFFRFKIHLQEGPEPVHGQFSPLIGGTLTVSNVKDGMDTISTRINQCRIPEDSKYIQTAFHLDGIDNEPELIMFLVYPYLTKPNPVFKRKKHQKNLSAQRADTPS